MENNEVKCTQQVFLVIERLTNPDGAVEDLATSAHHSASSALKEALRLNANLTNQELSYHSLRQSIPLVSD